METKATSDVIHCESSCYDEWWVVLVSLYRNNTPSAIESDSTKADRWMAELFGHAIGSSCTTIFAIAFIGKSHVSRHWLQEATMSWWSFDRRVLPIPPL
mmetsp:Transcript_10538/g.21679  ORF Transcript_10538/g.21679 Transcript_10538/m.21679 type:complete len:99 (+) Transcript_10538:402-698(+)